MNASSIRDTDVFIVGTGPDGTGTGPVADAARRARADHRQDGGARDDGAVRLPFSSRAPLLWSGRYDKRVVRCGALVAVRAAPPARQRPMDPHMSLRAFIHDHHEEIICEFAVFANTAMPPGARMSDTELRTTRKKS
jgi:hypothetical protein